MDVKQFVEDLKTMLVDKDNTEIPAPWKQVPDAYKENFMDWLQAYKKESWDGIEETGWMIYDREYLAFLITKFLEEVKNDISPA